MLSNIRPSRIYLSCVSLETQTLAAFSQKETVQKEVKASVSQKATLSCNVSDSKTEVKWYKDGKLLISSRAIYSEAKGNARQLVIEKVETSDAGEYTCEAGGDKLIFKITVTGTKSPSTKICVRQISNIIHTGLHPYTVVSFSQQQ